MPTSDHRALRAPVRRPAVAAFLALVWLVAFALQATPSTEAAPGSGSAPTAASFIPVWLDSALAGAQGTSTTSPAGVTGPRLIVETGQAPIPTGRPAVRQPAVAAGVVVKPLPTSHALRGSASWYCRAGVSSCIAAHPDRTGVADMYAAAGPALRRAMCGSDASSCWRGRRVLVNGVAVVLADWCQCYKGERNEKVIDLYWDAWTRIPGVEGGVTVRW